jgi:hypothetical protein
MSGSLGEDALVIQVIVTGSRDATEEDARVIWRELDLIHEQEPIDLLIEGGARGADRLAHLWARNNNVLQARVYADWAEHGKAAGHIRNGEMLKRYPEARVLAFPKGKSPGTRNCIAQAIKLGREPRIVELKP